MFKQDYLSIKTREIMSLVGGIDEVDDPRLAKGIYKILEQVWMNRK